MPINKKTLISGSLLLALAGLTIWLLLKDQELPRLFALLAGLKKGWILTGVVLMFCFVGFEAMSTRLVLRHLGHKPSLRHVLGYSFVGFYVSSITPSSSGGQPAQVYYMSKDGIPVAHGTLDMVLLTVCVQIATLFYALVALFFRPGLLAAMGTGLRILLLYGTGINLVLAAGMILSMFWPALAEKLAGGILALLVGLRIIRDKEKWQGKLNYQMEEYARGAQYVLTHPSLVPKLLGLTLLQLTCQYAVPFTVFKAFGLTGHGAFEMICAQALLTLAVSMLPMPGAVGPSEGGFVKFFVLFFGTGLVTPAVLVSRGISFYAFLVVSGLITLAVHLSSKSRS